MHAVASAACTSYFIANSPTVMMAYRLFTHFFMIANDS